jgi:acetyl esterase
MRSISRLRRFPQKLRREAGALLVDNFFRGASRVGKWHPNARPEKHDVEVLKDVAYDDTGLPEHRLDIYRPRALSRGEVEKVPIVLYVHGGGFRILSKDTHWVMGLAYARRGYLVFNISYRLAPKHRFPAALEDVCRALAWVKDNAGLYGGDLDRLIFAGESAGANLVTALAMTLAYQRPEPWARRAYETGLSPRAVVAACGIYQIDDIERFRRRWPNMSGFIQDRLREVGDAYLGDRSRHDPRSLELAEPLTVLERGDLPSRPLPPFFVPCGTKDPLIDDSERLTRALERLGVPCEARYYPGEPHAFHAAVFTENARRCWIDTYRFLDRELADANVKAPSSALPLSNR